MRGRRRGPSLLLRAVIMILCGIAAFTAAAALWGFIDIEHITFETVRPYVLIGAVLGLIHLFLRPVLRRLTAPIGCITLGLSGTAIDIGLIYLAAYLAHRTLPGILFALVTSLVINTVAQMVLGN